MKLDTRFKKIQSAVDITALRDAILNATEQEWNQNSYRQDKLSVAKDVETILFKMNGQLITGISTSSASDEHPLKTFTWNTTWDKWKHLVEPVINQAISGYDGYERAFVNKCMLPRLRPGMEIPMHIDQAKSFDYSHRIHVPLSTNDGVVFTIDGERCVMEEGCAYEIDNKREHSVVNNGDSPRIHLLFDICIPKE